MSERAVGVPGGQDSEIEDTELDGGDIAEEEPTDADLDEPDEPDDDEPDDDEADDDDEDGNRARGGIPLAVLDFVVRSIVDDPESVFIEVDEHRGRVELTVSVAPSDTGKIIGRRGHVVQAIRTLVRAAGARSNMDVSVEIAD